MSSMLDFVKQHAAKEKAFGQDYQAPKLKPPKAEPVKKPAPKKPQPKKKPVKLVEYTSQPWPPMQLFPVWVRKNQIEVFRLAQYDIEFRKTVFSPSAQTSEHVQSQLIQEAKEKVDMNRFAQRKTTFTRLSPNYPELTTHKIELLIKEKNPIPPEGEITTHAVVELVIGKAIMFKEDKPLFGKFARALRELGYNERRPQVKMGESYWSIKT